MSTRFHMICLSIGLATGLAGVAVADSPAGKSATVETAGMTESVEAPANTATGTVNTTCSHVCSALGEHMMNTKVNTRLGEHGHYW